MNELRAIAGADVQPALRTAWWIRSATNFLSRSAGYLRGLTLARVGFVLLICIIFTARQQSLCWFQVKCGTADMGTLAGGVHFLARQFPNSNHCQNWLSRTGKAAFLMNHRTTRRIIR